MKKIILLFVVLTTSVMFGQTTITQWDFENDVITPSVGSGTASLVGGTTATFANGVGGSPNRGWNTTNYPAQSTGSGTRGVEFAFSTTGYENITISYDQRASGTASRWFEILVSTDGGITYVKAYDNNGGTTPYDNFINFSFDLSAFSTDVEDAEDVRIRILSVFSPVPFSDGLNNNFSANTAYHRSRVTGGSGYGSGGTVRYDNVTITGEVILPSIATSTCNTVYNVEPGETISANPYPGATNYRFKFVDGSLNEYFIGRPSSSMTINQFASFIGGGFQYGETYTASV